MNKPERNRDGQTDDVSPSNPLVPFSMGEKFVTKTSPCNSLRVVLLGLLTRPDIRPLDRKQDVSLVFYDSIHHDL
jgi:hypothetical protein